MKLEEAKNLLEILQNGETKVVIHAVMLWRDLA